MKTRLLTLTRQPHRSRRLPRPNRRRRPALAVTRLISLYLTLSALGAVLAPIAEAGTSNGG